VTTPNVVQGFTSANAYWKFRDRVLTSHRYILDADSDEFLTTLREQARARELKMPAGKILWRAQLGCDRKPVMEGDEEIADEPIGYGPERMKPLKDRAREGRVNPKGIPCLYLAIRKETAMSEVRPWLRSAISLAQFKILRDVTIVNCFTKEKARRLFMEGTPREDWDKSVWEDIDGAFAEPISQDDEAEYRAHYAPTQIIAEFLKAQGLDGIAYRSAFGEGYNIALFDVDAADLVNCTVYDVRKITFDFHECANPYFISKHYENK
jgi:hypothetical protein